MKKIEYVTLVLLSSMFFPSCTPDDINTEELKEDSPEWVRQQMIKFIEEQDAERFLDVGSIEAIPAATDTNAYAEIDLEVWKNQARNFIALMREAERSQEEADKTRLIFIESFDAIQAAKSKEEADSIALYYSQWIGLTQADGTVIEPSRSPESYFEEKGRLQQQ